MTAIRQVQVVELPEIHLIGLSITSPFKGHQPDRVEKMKQEFLTRKDEISNAIRPERCVSPSFSSEVLFTYFVCMEAADLSAIPEGMIGFTVPPHRYAKVVSAGDPYQDIREYLKGNRLRPNERALALEVYHFENPVWPSGAEVFVPILE
ncbi:GyrI-like domain-containing protein [Paenibacillus antri]|uniref:GyrI-like domain-containing protein n=1 Tax=Paenibacillus antri TaxID=2582848 RepID=A0A5R9GH39_9BACL|nr:GyrI-like domain-containing protein [Paenibacillus antri]TLS50745.1 GyrI-like domain-containing protein [Paenibacillus antri]